VEIVEVEGRGPGSAREWEALASRAAAEILIACDERGEGLASRDLAALLARLRDAGTRRLAFLLGGADGLDPAARARADRLLAFGPQTWPHALVRAMLAEQVYRATTILAGSPYHRD
jgi:23S rRNA (pseudouridine1915-N3)-methyltransferase